MTIKPCHNKVLIEYINSDREILVLDADKDPDAKAIVFAIGPDVKCVKVGDRVLPRPGANIVELNKKLTDGKIIGLLDDSAIYLIIEDDAPTNLN